MDPNMESASQEKQASMAEDSESQDKQPSVAETNEPQNSESKDGGSFAGGMFLILFINFLVFGVVFQNSLSKEIGAYKESYNNIVHFK